MENLEKYLSEHPFLAGMNETHIKLMAGCASNVVFKAGQFIFREGEPADKFYLIRHGKVVVETFIPQKGPLVIRTRAEDDIFGWSWMVPPYKWHFDARASELTRALALDGKCLREKCEDDHDLGYELMKRFATVIAERLEATRLQLMDVYGNNS
jgi:CRP/FNR family cyclic AMP-dependent transcriptional regulator